MTSSGPALRSLLLLALGVIVLSGCATSSPPPVEDREVTTRVREPAAEDSEGVQVYGLQNPAVEQLVGQATAAESAGNLDQASMLLERALQIQPRNAEVLQRMAEVRLQQGQWDQAIGFATRSFDTGPRVGEICARNWRTIGVAREKLGDTDGARDAARRLDECMSTKPRSL